MQEPLDQRYWSSRYQEGNTGWDIGYVSTPIKDYVDQLGDKKIRILIPGAGNAYEAAYLHAKGFSNVKVLDLSLLPLEAFARKNPDFPLENLVQDDFFNHKGKYDLIIEQTFFCALDPSLRSRYLEKMKSLLDKGGKLVGVLFNIPLFDDHPPFGGDREQYLDLFNAQFESVEMEICYNSIPERAGNELFIQVK